MSTPSVADDGYLDHPAAHPLNDAQVLSYSSRYAALGLPLVLIPAGSKHPVVAQWQLSRPTTAEVYEHVRHGGNVGVNLTTGPFLVIDAENQAATDTLLRAGFHAAAYTANSLPGGDRIKQGGAHFYFRLPATVVPGTLPTCPLQVPLPGGGLVDVLYGDGRGRQACAPPSRLAGRPCGYIAVGGGPLDPSAEAVLPEAPAWLFDAAVECPAELTPLSGCAAPGAPREPRELTVESMELSAQLDAIPWAQWIAGDHRLTPSGQTDSCGCEIFTWHTSEHAKSITFHEGCEKGFGAHLWSGTAQAELNLDHDHCSKVTFAAALRHGGDVTAAAAEFGIAMGGGGGGLDERLDRMAVAWADDEAAILHFRQRAADADAAGDSALASRFRASEARCQLAVTNLVAYRAENAVESTAVLGGMSDAGPMPHAVLPASPAPEPQPAPAPVESAPITGTTPAADPALAAYHRRAELEADPGYELALNPGQARPEDLLPTDLRSLDAAVCGPRASTLPVVALAREAEVAQALALATCSKLQRDSQRSAQRDVWWAWDGARWATDQDAAERAVEALICSHPFASAAEIRQVKVGLLSYRKPDKAEEEAQRAEATAAAAAKGKLLAPEWHPQRVPVPADDWAAQRRTRTAICRDLGRQPGMATPAHAFDADPRVLGTPTAYLILTEDGHRAVAPDPALRVSKLLGAAYDPSATAPTWARFLTDALPDPDVRGFFHRSMGSTLEGRVAEQVILTHTGVGANGKGRALGALQAVLGAYGVTLPQRALTTAGANDHPAVMMPLRGARLAVVSELPEGVGWNSNLVKTLVGGDRLTARFMGENPVEWDPTHTIALATNGRPTVPPGDGAFWRRYREVQWTQRWATTADELPGAVGMADTGLEARLLAERSGILNWLLAGYAEYRRRGLDEPAQVLAWGREARSESSGFAAWCRTAVEVTGDPADALPVSAAWSSWDAYRKADTDAAHQRPTSARQLPKLAISELGSRVGYRQNGGGKAPAALTGVRLTETGRAMGFAVPI